MAKKKDIRGTDNMNEKSSEDLPGYPHYPSEQDITNPEHGFRKISADDELANSRSISNQSVNEKRNQDASADEEDDLGIVSGTEADVTEDDLAILGDRDADQDMNDDELTRKARVDEIESEDDLDVPGSEIDDENEALGEEDEENNYYSLGGDRHESLEDDPAGGNE